MPHTFWKESVQAQRHPRSELPKQFQEQSFTISVGSERRYKKAVAGRAIPMSRLPMAWVLSQILLDMDVGLSTTSGPISTSSIKPEDTNRASVLSVYGLLVDALCGY